MVRLLLKIFLIYYENICCGTQVCSMGGKVYLMYDILIKNGYIIDGTGTPWYKSDIAVSGSEIVEIGDLDENIAENVIDAEGAVVSPGFIDVHTHSDITLLVNGLAESKVRQGVTTEVIGNCGSSPAPVMGEAADQLEKELREDYDIGMDWTSLSEYIDTLKKTSTSVNLVPLVGHGALRKSVLAYENRKPTRKEIEEMKKLLAEAMDAGAFGFSSGLIYAPSCYAEVDELIELAHVAAERYGIYTTHMRYEGDKLIEGVREALEIGEKSGVAVQISHHKVTTKKSWGLVKGSLAMMHNARERGIDVTCDVYPYIATSTGLDSILPAWAHEGGLGEMMPRIKDTETRKRILDDLIKHQRPRGWENIVVSSVKSEENKQLEGKNLLQISKLLDLKPEEAVLELLYQEKAKVGMVRFAMCEEDVKQVIGDELTMIGSDASARADYGLLAKGKPHPRAFGTFPRVLGKYSRDEGVVSLEKAIYKMTGFPAWRLGIDSKGVLKKGMDADITIFAPEEIKDEATFINPYQYPKGIDKVIVNGEIVLDNNEHTGNKPGRVLNNN
jgi:N-acyl-D-amino-acid deacylase